MRHIKKLVAGLLTVLLLFLCACSTNEASSAVTGLTPSQVPSSSSLPVISEPEPEPEPQPIEHRVSFSAVGDNLIHEAIYLSAQDYAGGEGYDFSYAYENAAYFFQDYDVNWINQETLVNDELDASTYPTFSTPGECGRATYDAGWRVYALSNNHTYDKGAAGISATLRYWENMPENVVSYGLFTGYEDDSGIAIQEVNGLTIAYVAFTYGTNGIPRPSNTEAFVIETSEWEAQEYKVRRARELADVLIVSAHWGTENSHTIHPSQVDLAQAYADWGADIIVGTHPHVIQDLDWITSEDGRQVPVAYSLGNFLSAQSETSQLVGLVLTCDIVQIEQPDGTREAVRIENLAVRPTVTQYERPQQTGKYHYPRTYLFRDYTDELAAEHYVRVTKNNNWGRAFIQQLVESYISPEYLILD